MRAGRIIKEPFFVSIDFDGTASDLDITDAVIQKFAGPGWEEAERLWEKGVIGSQECLSIQMALIESSLDEVMDYLDDYTVNETFGTFITFLQTSSIPFAIISDGFDLFIKKLLQNEGLKDVSVFASRLGDGAHGLKASFPYSGGKCTAATCKCKVAGTLSRGHPFIHIGDGRSDYCIAAKAHHVFSKDALTRFCGEKRIAHTPFIDFSDVEETLRALMFDGAGRAYEDSLLAFEGENR